MRQGKPKSRYLSYLLRLWQTADGDAQVWRISLERPGSCERVSFTSLAELVTHLQREMQPESLARERSIW